MNVNGVDLRLFGGCGSRTLAKCWKQGRPVPDVPPDVPCVSTFVHSTSSVIDCRHPNARPADHRLTFSMGGPKPDFLHKPNELNTPEMAYKPDMGLQAETHKREDLI